MWGIIKRMAQIGGWCAMFLLGWGWRALDVIGRGDVFWKLPDFVGGLQTFIAAHQEVGYQIAPWVFMVASLLALVLMQWPRALSFWKATSPQKSPAPEVPLIYQVAKESESYLNPASSIPDWMPAHELVEYVPNSPWASGRAMDGDTLLNHPGGYFIREFQQAARNGKLRCWGRKNGKGEIQEIPAMFWFSATIDVSSVHSDLSKTRPQGSERNTTPIVEDVPFYADLWFDRADVYKVWGEPSSSGKLA